MKENSSVLIPPMNAAIRKPVSIIIDWDYDAGATWIARLAFAKMLQIEATETHGVETELIILVENRRKATPWFKCFSRLSKSFRVIAGLNQLHSRKKSLIEWLGDKASILEATQDNWEDGLKLLNRLSKSELASFPQGITLPFLRVKSAPSLLHYWKHVNELIELLWVEPSCCEIPPMITPEILESHTTILFEDIKSSNILPFQLSNLIHRPKFTTVVFVTDQPEGLSDYAAALQHDHGYTIRFIHPGSFGANSEASRFCFLTQDTGYELVVTTDQSSIGLLAAMSNKASHVVRLVETRNDNDGPIIKYEESDPRSRMQLEKLALNTEPEIGSKLNPLSLLIHILNELEERIAQGYILQFYLEEKYNIYTKILLQTRKKKESKLIKDCFPRLQSLLTISVNDDEFGIRRNQMKTFGISGVFELDDMHAVDLIPDILQNTISSLPTALRRTAPDTVHSDVPPSRLTFPFLSMTQNFTIKAPQNFRERFNSLFALNRSALECEEVQFPSWDRLTKHNFRAD
eukprot:CAMPEP_0178897000 /NCGR_PEP_ID=MMETSP0786-20121207/1500_1 /TAXON_ID=186022 /ORGANISM="Thalassionema frauenfeldii, Strain CCMP 1798" /LENGTH=518 /DNA_ID=CAMNT_0020567495 /DNA_START=311 /DNA_END=1867 /DNA_ORIENTATION=-